VNLSSEQGHTVLEMIHKTEELTGKVIFYETVDRRLGDPAVVVASSRKAFELLGWKAQHSDIKEIIESMWNAYIR
jgi:UDP-glucose 4-epimerase